jgi:hypothetical protein
MVWDEEGVAEMAWIKKGMLHEMVWDKKKGMLR